MATVAWMPTVAGTDARDYGLDAKGYRLDAQGLQAWVPTQLQAWVPTVTGWFAYGCRLEHLQRRDDAVARALDEGLVPAQAAGGLLGGWVVRGGGWRVRM